jgi:hypothetical protein
MLKIGIALWLVTLLMTMIVTTGAFAAPPDEVNAPRTEEVSAV